MPMSLLRQKAKPLVPCPIAPRDLDIGELSPGFSGHLGASAIIVPRCCKIVRLGMTLPGCGVIVMQRLMGWIRRGHAGSADAGSADAGSADAGSADPMCL